MVADEDEYPPPSILSSVPEGVLVVAGPHDQSELYTISGRQAATIDRARGYTFAPDGSAVITQASQDTIAVRDLRGREVESIETGSRVCGGPAVSGSPRT